MVVLLYMPSYHVALGPSKLNILFMRKKKDKENEMEEGVIYKVNCKNCEKIYIEETKFRMKKGIEQHKNRLG